MIEKHKIVTTVVLGLAVVILLLCRSIAPKERAAEQQVVETNAVSSAQAEKVISNADGSVIVRDKGASFKIR
ncbi:MAG: hypothetical protein WC673_01770 [Candidatus Paceibacterota bacterium]|jgi:hypothetical protein